ncbi:MAG: alpha/beta hydrolase [Holophagales bacterium]|nr:alpha/beta hydrolase [Holophagales bacterium]
MKRRSRNPAFPLLILALLTAPAWPQEPAAPPAATQTSGGQPAAGPLALFRAFSRAQLAGLGFERHEVTVRLRGAAGSEGREQVVVWWEKAPEAVGAATPPLVMIHGVLDQAGGFFQVAGALSEARRVLLVDLPGHGESPPAEGPLPLTRIRSSFEAWLAEAAPETPAILVGNSMGAWVALLAARHQPERVARVVAVNGGGLTPDPGDGSEAGELDLLPESRDQARRLMALLRDPAFPPTPDAVLDDLVREAPTAQVSRMFEAEADLERHLLDGRLGEIAVPVDLLWGESDRYLGKGYAERLLRGLPRARLTWIPTCGHVPQVECPQRFVEMLGGLLDQDPPAARNTRPPKKEDSP